MSFLNFMKRLLVVKRPRGFTLGKRMRPGIPGAREDVVRGKHTERPPHTTPGVRAEDRSVWGSPGHRPGNSARPDSRDPASRSPFGGMSPEKRQLLSQNLSESLDKNLQIVMDIFHAPRNRDLVTRGLEIRCKDGNIRAAVVYMEGLVELGAVRDHLIHPLLSLNTRGAPVSVNTGTVMRQILTEASVYEISTFAHATAALVEGQSIVLVDGEATGITADTRSIEHRQVEESPTEAVVRGPHEGFVENFRTNSTLVRSYMATPDLVSEVHYVGARSHSPIALFYLEGVANPKLVEEMRRRLQSVRHGSVIALAALIEFVMDSPGDPFPTFIATERPDRVASMLEEGHLALIDGSPTALLFPSTIWALMHSAEDYYVSPLPATFLRIVRWMALIATTYSSALYVAVVNYHPEMIPTELMLAIASSREAVPFPAVVEVLLMEVTFELVREAGIRIPTVIGPTIGIVGAVILGQAAVQASIVSPVLVVVVAVSGLGSFGIPNYDLGLYARVLRFAMILVASAFGIPGLTLATIVLLARITSTTSLGVPVTAPLVPSWRHSADLLLRGMLFRLKARPAFLRPLDETRAPDQPRTSPAPGDATEHQGQGGGETPA